jgi:serine/threonine protein phosphatase PrpC
MQSEPLRDALLYVAQDALEYDLQSLAGGAAAVCAMRCPGKEAPNEDAAALIPAGDAAGVLVVADGVGGERAGAQASEIAVRCLRDAVSRSDDNEVGLRAAILDGIERANAVVNELGIGAATTLAAVEICDGWARPYHVGDSMILVVGQRGKIKLQTIAHSPVGFALEAGVIDEREALHHEERHVVSNVLGTRDMRIEVGSALRLARHDTLLIASDGLFDNLRVDEIVEQIRKGPIASCAARLAAVARRRMTEPAAGEPSKPDDLSFVIFRAHASGRAG